jgi:formylglycine-generating enzyme
MGPRLLVLGLCLGCSPAPLSSPEPATATPEPDTPALPDKLRPRAQPILEASTLGLARIDCPRPLDGGTTLWFRGHDAQGQARLYQARFEGTGWTADPQPVLDTSPLDQIGCPAVLQEGTRTRLWLSTRLADGRRGLVQYSSTQGSPLRRSQSPPLMAAAPPLGPELWEPFVRPLDGGYQMLMRCGSRWTGTLCSADSADGESWRLRSDLTLPEHLSPSAPDEATTLNGSPSVWKIGDEHHFIFTHRAAWMEDGEEVSISAIRHYASSSTRQIGEGHKGVWLKPHDTWLRAGMTHAFPVGADDLSNLWFASAGPQGGIGLAIGEHRPKAQPTPQASPPPPALEPEQFSRRLLDNGAEVLTAGDTQATLLPIPAGQFQMGSPQGQSRRDIDEHEHRVRLSRPMLAGQTEVTQALYAAVTGENPSAARGALLPVERVSWYQAVAFCNQLSERLGLEPAYDIDGTDVQWRPERSGYRLPTEAEWEYLARAGRPLSTGVPEPLEAYAWFFENAQGRTHPVGTKRANPWGLHDTFGNVYEWTVDWKARYPGGPVTDPAALLPTGFKVERGGSFRNGRGNLRVANRGRLPPEVPSLNLGFRIVRTPAAE